MKYIKSCLSLMLAFTVILGLSACGSSNPTAVTVNGKNVSINEYNYFFYSLKDQAESNISKDQIDVYWTTEKDGKTPLELLKEKAMDELLNIYVAAVKAEEAGIALEDSDNAALEDIKKQVKGQLDDQAFYKFVHSDAPSMDKIAQSYLLRQKLFQQLAMRDESLSPNDNDLKQYFNENYLYAQHILFLTVDTATNAELPADVKEQKLQKAKTVLEKVRNGADFVAAMNENSEDTGLQANPNGYIFTKNEMVPEFENTVRSLNPGEISDIVETSYGYHIIKKLPLSAEGNPAEYDKLKNSKENNLFNIYMTDAFNKMIEDYKTSYTIEINKEEIEKLK